MTNRYEDLSDIDTKPPEMRPWYKDPPQVSCAISIVLVVVGFFGLHHMYNKIAGSLQAEKDCEVECLKITGCDRENCLQECDIRFGF